MRAKPILTGVALLLVALAGVFAWRAANEREGSGTVRAVSVEPDATENTPLTGLSAAELGGNDGEAEQRRVVEITPDAESLPTHAEQATIVVRFVTAETDEPIAGEPCFARDADAQSYTHRPVEGSTGEVGDTPHSGEDGIVRLHVPPGSYAVRHNARPYTTQDVLSLAAGETRTIVFELQNRADLVVFVRVLDAERELPLEGVELRLGDVPERVTAVTHTVRTDADGLASLSIPSWLVLTGKIEEAGFGPVVFRPMVLHDTPETALMLRLQKCAALRGHVLDDAEASIAGATIELECYEVELGTNDVVIGSMLFGIGSSSKRHWTATTDAQGSFQLECLPPGAYLKLRVSAGNESGDEFENNLRLEPGEQRSVTYRLGGGALLRGVLFDAESHALPKARLVLIPGGRSRRLRKWERDDFAGRTDTEGAFELSDVAAGDWLVGPEGGPGIVPWLTHVHVPEGAPVVDVALRLPPALELSGRTVGPAGEPVPNIRIEVSGDGQSLHGQSDDEGQFRFENLVEGELKLDARASGELVGAARVLAQAGDTNVVLELIPAATLNVHVFDEQGRPVVAEVTRATIYDDGSLGSVWYTTTDQEGLAVWRGVAPGLVRSLVRVEGGAVGGAGPTRLTSGMSVDVDIIVRAGGRLRILGAADTKGYSVVLDGMSVENDPLKPGVSVTSKAIPAGPVTVQWRAADGSVTTKEVVVIAGETVDVEAPK